VIAPVLAEAHYRELCTDCGLSRSREPGRCGRACQFIRPRYEALEAQVHGRRRDPERPDELHFGPFLAMVSARLVPSSPGAQWTGITTRLGAHLLETDQVDAVLATASEPDDRWRPRPVIVTEAAGMAACRGMKMGYSPLLALLDEAAARGLRRIAVIGIPCQVYALRALEAELGLEALYVIGTPCSDNTTTDRFYAFLDRLTDRPEAVTWLEFLPDYHVEMQFEGGERKRIPFIQLPIADLPTDFFPLTCRSCVDYTNVLADVTVGYMGGHGEQWLIVRNERGQALVDGLGDELLTHAPISRGDRTNAVRSFRDAIARTAGGLPTRRAPTWVKPLIGWMMTRFGPKGLEFARTRVEMKAVEAVLMLRHLRQRRMSSMLPDHIWRLAARYDLTPQPGEREPGDRGS
jgi:coenzyme F420 hydrogenase subunit beta